MKKIIIILIFGLQAQASIYDFPVINKLTQDYRHFVDEKFCSEVDWCDSPDELEEFAQYCTILHLTPVITVSCYNTYQSEADSECFMYFDPQTQQLLEYNKKCYLRYFQYLID